MSLLHRKARGKSILNLGSEILERKRLFGVEIQDSAPAAEWSHNVPRTLVSGVTAESLQVISLSSTRMTCAVLSSILIESPRLQKLDANRCGLYQLPARYIWERMTQLSILFLHRNGLTQWAMLEDLQHAASLEWLTIYENPIAGRMHFRVKAVENIPQLKALDYWIVTDEERVKEIDHSALRNGQEQQQEETLTLASRHTMNMDTVQVTNLAATVFKNASKRFRALSPSTILPFIIDKRHVPTGPALLIRNFEEQSKVMRERARFCSAVICIQSCWRSHLDRVMIENQHETKMRLIINLQSRARNYLWNRQMVKYLKGYLGEIDQLDLILSAKEMLALRASQRIETMVRQWVQRRKNRSQLRSSATLVSRVVKGASEREAFMYSQLELKTRLRVFVPESYAWELLVLVNVARRRRKMPPLPRGHKFEIADLLGVRVPETSDLPHRKSLMARLVAMRNAFIVRPVRSGRCRQFLWDGPPHQLGVDSSNLKMHHGRESLKRRVANVTNVDRRCFLESCVPGPHPIHRPVVPRKPNATNKCGRRSEGFLDIYDFGKILHSGQNGILFECLHKSSRPREGEQQNQPLVVKLVEHQDSWWFNVKADTSARMRFLWSEAKLWKEMKHRHIALLHEVFIDEFFMYAVMDRYECNIEVAAKASLRVGQRALPRAIVGSIAMQALRALEHLHRHMLVHRNICVDDFCVDSRDLLGRFHVILVDVLHCRYAEPGVMMTERASKRTYWAPEVIRKSYAHAADVWALGVTMWRLITFSFPFASLEETLQRELSKDSRTTEEQFEWLGRMLDKDAHQRCTAEDALQIHDIVDGYNEYKHRNFRTEDRELAEDAIDALDAVEVVQDASIGSVVEVAVQGDAAYNRRISKIQTSRDRYVQGLELIPPIEDQLDAIDREEPEPVEVTNNEWWSPDLQSERRKEGYLLDIETSAIGASAKPVDACRSAVLHSFEAMTLDVISTEALLASLPRKAANCKSELERFQAELAQRRCRLAFGKSSEPIRVVDLITLRIRSQSGKYLVRLKSDTFDPSSLVVQRASTDFPVFRQPKEPADAVPCFPSIVCEAFGSGRSALRADVRRLVADYMGMLPDSFDVHLEGGPVEMEIVDSSPDFVASVAGWSQAYTQLGMRDLVRRCCLDGVPWQGLSAQGLVRLGLPDEKVFKRVRADESVELWGWWDAERCHRHGLPIDVPPETIGKEILEGFRPVDRLALNRTDLPQVLINQGVDPQYFGVGKALTLRQFIDEAMWGSARLYVGPSRDHGLRRYIETVVTTVRAASGNILVSTQFKLGGGVHRAKSFTLPTADLQPLEDEIWAVRRLLQDLQVPHGEAKVHFGCRRAYPFDDPRYPGITSYRLEQTVEVILGEQDPQCLEAKDAGASRWHEGVTPEEPPEAADVELQLRELLEGPERNWPVDAKKDMALRQFMLEARIIGSRPRLPPKARQGPEVMKFKTADGEVALKNYRSAVWLGERLISYECDCADTASTLISTMLLFPGLGGDAPLVKRVPFLAEADAGKAAAAVVIQATYRAHRQRSALPCAPGTASVIRRAALCIQQTWRWSLTKRRLRLLRGALAVVRSVNSATLYVEERLFHAMNLINHVNRYAPMMRERHLGFGLCEKTEKVVIVRGHTHSYGRRQLIGAHGGHRRRTSAEPPTGQETSKIAVRSPSMIRAEDSADWRIDRLPAWLLNVHFDIVNADESTFKSVAGLQGLLLDGITTQTSDEHLTPIAIPSLIHAGHLAEATGASGIGIGGLECGSAALAACDGVLRFVELKFPSLEMAQRRALLVYMCTFNSNYSIGVPLLTRPMLQSAERCAEVIRVWDIYGLTWPARDRATIYNIKKRYGKTTEFVQVNGRESLATICAQRSHAAPAPGGAPRERRRKSVDMTAMSSPTASVSLTPRPPSEPSPSLRPQRRFTGTLAAGSALVAARTTMGASRPMTGSSSKRSD